MVNNNAATGRKLATTSGSPKSYVRKSQPTQQQQQQQQEQPESGQKQVHVVALNSHAAVDDSPPLGRLDMHPAPLHLLEQIFHAPGGGVELRTVLGIYTSRRAAEHAARCYCDTNKEKTMHFEHLRLETSEVPVDKAASDSHAREPVVFCEDK
jgi:hypothetical protein